jgi:ABC-2 type transport system permease protein
MNKIWLIVKREYLTRVKKKSFILMTILGPLLIGGLYGFGFYMIVSSANSISKIKLIDESGLFKSRLSKAGNIIFETDTTPLNRAKEIFDPNEYAGILFIPKDIIGNPASSLFYARKQPGIEVVDRMETQIEKELEDYKLNEALSHVNPKDFDKKMLQAIKTKVRIRTKLLTENGEEDSSVEATSIIGFAGGLLMFFFTFLYGVQVMRGVIEEKTSRIVEVIISSVKPFQLMMGKIIGIALVGLTQFFLWIVLSLFVTSAITYGIKNEEAQKIFQKNIPGHEYSQSENSQVKINTVPLSTSGGISDYTNAISALPLTLIIFSFIFYFLGGYLFYASLFAAIGSAIDSETDTQQFMMLITMPLMLGYFAAISMMNNPESPFGYWLSFVPFTSPIVMMVRLPFGVPIYELIISMALLVLGFVSTTWMAAKIYRTGILMYGKKPSWKELGKWLFYRG